MVDGMDFLTGAVVRILVEYTNDGTFVALDQCHNSEYGDAQQFGVTNSIDIG